MSEETKTSEQEETKTSGQEEINTSDREEAKTSDQEETKTSDQEEAKTSDPEEAKTSDPEEAKTSDPEEAKTSDQEEAKTSDLKEAKTSDQEETKNKAYVNPTTATVGQLVSGSIVKITGNVAFVNYGARNEGYIELSELKDEAGELQLAEGDELQAEVVSARGAVQLSYRKAQAGVAMESLREAWKNKTPVEGRVVAVNKGGFEVRVDGVRAFCPASQISVRFIDEPAREVGSTYEFIVTEFSKKKGLVVSRRALLEVRKAEALDNLGERVKPGDRLQGKVTQIKDFGAFVDLGEGLEGMVHVSEISHERVTHPRESLTVGDAIEVEVLRIDTGKGQVGLSIKRLQGDPWTNFVDGIEKGAVMKGKVERIQPFGAFVNLAPGVDGLLHVSAITAEKRIENPSEILSVGDEVEVIVDKIEKDRQRIGLMTPAVAESRVPVKIGFKVGDVVTGSVVKIEQFGVIIQLDERLQGLVPNAEMGTHRGSDHRRLFPIGTEIEAKVLEIDRRRNRIRLSRKAMEMHAEEEAYKDFRKRENAPESLGSFGDLLQNFMKDKE
jgi:small subunit ribosomal protein S1